MQKRTLSKTARRSHVKGWQTISEAAAQSGLSRQRIHLLVKDKRISCREMLGLKLVPCPLPKAKPPI